MAGNELKETLTNRAKRQHLEAEIREDSANEDEDEKQIEDLEREVKESAQKIADFRNSVPLLLDDIISSANLALLRPKLSLALTSVASQHNHSVIEGPLSELAGRSSVTEDGERELEKLNYLREKAASSIIAVAPVILKRVNECLARINAIEQNNVNLPSFKRKKQ